MLQIFCWGSHTIPSLWTK